jgi:hypothetical protein
MADRRVEVGEEVKVSRDSNVTTDRHRIVVDAGNGN